VVLATGREAPEIAQPREKTLDLPTPPIASQWTAVLGEVAPIPSVWCDELDAKLVSHSVVERVAIKRFVPNHPSGSSAGDRADDFFDQGDLRGRGAVDGKTDWKTMTVDHCHPLRTFAAFGLTNSGPPFFADAKLPSTNDSSRSNLPRFSRSSRSARRIWASVPSRHQR